MKKLLLSVLLIGSMFQSIQPSADVASQLTSMATQTDMIDFSKMQSQIDILFKLAQKDMQPKGWASTIGSWILQDTMSVVRSLTIGLLIRYVVTKCITMGAELAAPKPTKESKPVVGQGKKTIQDLTAEERAALIAHLQMLNQEPA